MKEYANFGGNGGGVMKSKRPEDLTAEKKLKAVVEYENLDEEQRGKYLREKGLHSVHLERWQQEFVEAYASRKKKTKGVQVCRLPITALPPDPVGWMSFYDASAAPRTLQKPSTLTNTAPSSYV